MNDVPMVLTNKEMADIICLEVCGLCLHPKDQHFDKDKPKHCCDGCGGFMTHKEFRDNPTYWSISDTDGVTVLDGINAERPTREVLVLLKQTCAELDAARKQIEQRDALLNAATQFRIPTCKDRFSFYTTIREYDGCKPEFIGKWAHGIEDDHRSQSKNWPLTNAE